MTKNIFYIILLILLSSCKSQQITVGSIYGSFVGIEKKSKHELSWSVQLELNQDGTCVLKKLFDLSKIECKGEWIVLKGNLIKINCNKNPILSNIEKALQGGSFIEGNIEMKILNQNKLKFGDIVLSRTSIKRNIPTR